MAGDLFDEQERRIAARFKHPKKCTLYDTLEMLHTACVSAGSERFVGDQLRKAHGVDLDAIELDLPRLQETVNAFVVRALILLETRIAESDLFLFRDVILKDQFGVRFVDQLDFIQLSRYIEIMRAVVDRHSKK